MPVQEIRKFNRFYMVSMGVGSWREAAVHSFEQQTETGASHLQKIWF